MISGSEPDPRCIEWEKARDKDGYGYTWSKGYSRRAHRMAWELFVGPIPPGKLVLHHCDNPPCINIDHLFLGTPADNTRDAQRKGRLDLHGLLDFFRPQGERHPMARLSAAQVEDIRRAYRPRQVTIHALAKQYGVGATQIHRIVTGQSWRRDHRE